MSNWDIWTVGILSGIIASVLASAILWVMLRFWRDTVLPRYAKLIYRGLNFEDKWENILPPESNEQVTAEMDLIQYGYTLTGTMKLHIKGPERTDHFDYLISGEVMRDFIKIHTTPVSHKRLTFSCGIFKMLDHGDAMVGSSVYIKNTTSEVDVHQNVKWTRKSG